MLILDEYETTDIALETAQGNPISNVQCREISLYNRALFGNLEKKYGEYIEKRVEPSAIYNCHGLVFASRRTAIESSVEVTKILRDDNYIRIMETNVRPGDIIVYFDDGGDPEHSGIVIEPPTREHLMVPWVLSKWGCYAEVLHLANQCPYQFNKAVYYRADVRL